MAVEVGANRLSYSSSGPMELRPGVSNYVLQVLSRRRTHSDNPTLLMYFLDSGGGVQRSGQVVPQPVSVPES